MADEDALAADSVAESDPAFGRLLDTLSESYNFDFREYKAASLARRIRTRMGLVHADSFETYARHLSLGGGGVRATGGRGVVDRPPQDPREAPHPSMPRRAIAEDDVDAVLPLDGIAAALVDLARGRVLQEPRTQMHR